MRLKLSLLGIGELRINYFCWNFERASLNSSSEAMGPVRQSQGFFCQYGSEFMFFLTSFSASSRSVPGIAPIKNCTPPSKISSLLLISPFE